MLSKVGTTEGSAVVRRISRKQPGQMTFGSSPPTLGVCSIRRKESRYSFYYPAEGAVVVGGTADWKMASRTQCLWRRSLRPVLRAGDTRVRGLYNWPELAGPVRPSQAHSTRRL